MGIQRAAATAGARVWSPLQSHAMSRALVLAIAVAGLGCKRETLYLGDYRATDGNCYGAGVSRDFGEAEARKLHARLSSPAIQAEVQRYTCPRIEAPFAVSVALQYDGQYQERRVRFGTTPAFSDGCTERDPLGYVYARELKALDPGPPIGYGYRHADGTPASPVPWPVWKKPDVLVCPSAAP